MTFKVSQLTLACKKRITTHISNLAAPATGNSTFTRLKHDEIHTYSLQIFTVWSYKPPEHSPIGSLFQCCPKKKTKYMGPYFLNSPRISEPLTGIIEIIETLEGNSETRSPNKSIPDCFVCESQPPGGVFARSVIIVWTRHAALTLSWISCSRIRCSTTWIRIRSWISSWKLSCTRIRCSSWIWRCSRITGSWVRCCTTTREKSGWRTYRN